MTKRNCNASATNSTHPCRVVDATSLDEVAKAVLDEANAIGKIDGIVNCVGSTVLKPAHLTSPDEWQDILANNLTAAFITVRVGYQTMKTDGGVHARCGTRVNAVAPSLVQTRLSEPTWSNHKLLLPFTPIRAVGRIGQPHDIASIISWPLESENDWGTGQVFGIDGSLETLRVPER